MIMVALKSSTESLKGALEKFNKLDDNNYEKELEDIEKSLNVVKDHYMAVSKDKKYEIIDVLENVRNAKSESRSLKLVLDNLAKSTILRVDSLKKALKKFENAAKDDKNIQRYFFKIVRNMKNLLRRSDQKLKDALEKYKSLTIKLNAIKSVADKFVIQLDDFMKMKDGELQKWIDKYRAEAYGGTAACVVFLPLCPILYAATSAGVETTIGNVKEDLKKQKSKFRIVKNAITKLIGQVDNGLKFIEEEEPLIRNWAIQVEFVEDELPSAEDLVKDIKTGYADLEELRRLLDELRKACQQYISHS
jgi:hypothetical protein